MSTIRDAHVHAPAEMRVIRTQLALTNADIAALLGVSDPSTYRAWEYGNRNPRGAILADMRVLREVTAGYAADLAMLAEAEAEAEGRGEVLTFPTNEAMRAAMPGGPGFLSADWHRAATGLAAVLAVRPVPVRWWEPGDGLSRVVRTPEVEALLVELGFTRPGSERDTSAALLRVSESGRTGSRVAREVWDRVFEGA